MSWLTDLLETYELCKNEIDVPLFHIKRNSNFEIVLDGSGQFKRVNIISGKNKLGEPTIIPCTEKSENSRTGSSKNPHPLSDQLKYVAKEFYKYDDIKNESFNKECYELYHDILKNWVDSEYSNKYIKCIYNYISQGNIINDIYGNIKKDNIVEDKKKLIRWVIEESPDKPQIKLWLDKTMHNSWINYTKSQFEINGICQLTNEPTYCITLYPGNIMHNKDSAKIISSNDTDGFTYRGWFSKDNLPFKMGSETNQKIFKTLNHLIKKQGFQCKLDRNFILAWSIDVKLPELFNMKSLSDIYPDIDFNVNEISTSEEYANTLNKRLFGYKSKLQSSKDIVIFGSESVTKGRRNVFLYEKFNNSTDFLDIINKWYTTCVWVDKNESLYTPSPYQIINALYGKDCPDSLKFNIIKKVIYCIIYNRKMPESIFNRLINRVSNIHTENWKTILSVTLPIIYRKYNENKENISMSLDETRLNRSYLFGRLLAIADNVEEWSLKSKGTKRTTIAKKYWKRFCQQPASTWSIIYDKIMIHFTDDRISRKNLIDEIINKFDINDFTDVRLDAEYLLAYSSQIKKLLNKTEETDNE